MRVSVVIPARNEARNLRAVVEVVLAQAVGHDLEIIVIDDGSSDGTAAIAEAAGARVVRSASVGGPRGGNPGAARNLGARESLGEVIIFLDADCLPQDGWLDRLLEAHGAGRDVVGGSLAMPSGLKGVAKADYYGCWYLTHPGRPAGPVRNHPPANLSVRRETFLGSRGFTEEAPVCDGKEELGWQERLAEGGQKIWFEPAAMVAHRHQPGVMSLLRRNYRWGYTNIQAKSESGAVRLAGLYRYPRLLVALSVPLAIPHTLFVVACWLKARRWGVLGVLPYLVVGRLAYGWGMAVGGLRWLRSREGSTPRAALVAG